MTNKASHCPITTPLQVQTPLLVVHLETPFGENGLKHGYGCLGECYHLAFGPQIRGEVKAQAPRSDGRLLSFIVGTFSLNGWVSCKSSSSSSTGRCTIRTSKDQHRSFCSGSCVHKHKSSPALFFGPCWRQNDCCRCIPTNIIYTGPSYQVHLICQVTCGSNTRALDVNFVRSGRTSISFKGQEARAS